MRAWRACLRIFFFTLLNKDASKKPYDCPPRSSPILDDCQILLWMYTLNNFLFKSCINKENVQFFLKNIGDFRNAGWKMRAAGLAGLEKSLRACGLAGSGPARLHPYRDQCLLLRNKLFGRPETSFNKAHGWSKNTPFILYIFNDERQQTDSNR